MLELNFLKTKAYFPY